MSGKPWTEAEIQLIIDTFPTHTIRAQADLLPGRTMVAIRERRRWLIERGKLDPTTRAQSRPWTEDEYLLAVLLIQEGMSVAHICRRLRRSPDALYNYLLSRGVSLRALRRDPLMTTRSAAEVARLFGVSDRTLLSWIDQRRLQARRNQKWQRRRRRQFTFWLITDEMIRAFLQDQANWPCWDVARMTDPHWQAEAIAIQQQAAGCWLTVREYAMRMHYSEAAVHRWIRLGLLPATSAHNAYWIWSEDGAAFVPPLVARYQERAA